MKKSLITALAFVFVLPFVATSQTAAACPQQKYFRNGSAKGVRGQQRMQRRPRFRRRARRRILRRDHQLMRHRGVYRHVLRKGQRHRQLERFRKTKQNKHRRGGA